MTTGPMPMGMICCGTICDTPCPEIDCNCLDPNTGLQRCFADLQVKVTGVTSNPNTIPGGFVCGNCGTVFNGIWNQYACANNVGAGPAPLGRTGEDNWVEIFADASPVDPCTGTAGTRKVWIRVTQGSPTTTVEAQFESKTDANESWAYMIWNFTVLANDCPDFTDTSEFSPASVSTSAGTNPCDFSAATFKLRWA